eukprot:PRCOL_00006394-RA
MVRDFVATPRRTMPSTATPAVLVTMRLVCASNTETCRARSFAADGDHACAAGSKVAPPSWAASTSTLMSKNAQASRGSASSIPQSSCCSNSRRGTML